MQTYKVWALAINQVTDNDILWLKGLGVDIKYEPMTNKVYSAGHKVTEYVTGHKIDVITTCEKQETMLQLKYSTALQLISIVFPPDENINMASHSRSAA